MSVSAAVTNKGEWFLKIGHHSVGPLPIEEVQSLFQTGDIQPLHQLTSVEIKGEWIVAKDLILALKQMRELEIKKQTEQQKSTLQATSQAQSLNFKAPLRPLDIGKMSETKPNPAYDPTVSLFDTLQAVKEKKSNVRIVVPMQSQPSLYNTLKSHMTSQTWLILLLVLVLIFASFGVLKLLEQTLKPIPVHKTLIESTAVETQTKPGAPAHPKPVSVTAPKANVTPYRPQPAHIKPVLPPTKLTPPPPSLEEEKRDDDRNRDENQNLQDNAVAPPENGPAHDSRDPRDEQNLNNNEPQPNNPY